jgi:HK97 family phage portal protein
MTAFAFWQSLMSIALLYGNAYARIIRGTGSRPASLQLYPAGSVSLHTYKNDLYATTPDGVLPYYELFHLRGLGHGVEGKSPIRQAAENMGISLNAQTFANKFFENGANVGGVLKHPAKLSDTAFNHLRDSWAERHSGVNNAHKPAILEEGMDYARIGIPPNEAQMLETRLFGITDICRIYGVPPHKIAELSKATFSNIEQQNIEFLTDSLLPWLIRIEQECNRKLFRAAEKGRFYCKFNVNALMRGDSAARATFYKELFSIGVFSQNDIRELEEQNPIEGGDRYYVQGNNMVPIDKIDALLAAQTGPEAPKKEENEPE